MDFKTFFLGMTVPQRDAFATKVMSTRGMLTQVAYGNKPVELGFADVICAVSGYAVSLDGLPLTENARRQRAVREILPAPASAGA
jgi:hypothetical protein